MMLVQFLLSSSVGSANAYWLRSITGIDCINGTVICVFAQAAFIQGKRIGYEILSLLVFVDLRHKRLSGVVSSSEEVLVIIYNNIGKYLGLRLF